MADSGYTSEGNNIQTIVLEKGETGYGFNIRGGTDNCHVGDDPGIFVTSMRPDGAAAKDGRLKKGDRIISVNGRNIAKVTHEIAVNAFRVASEKVVLVFESGAELKIKRQLEGRDAVKEDAVITNVHLKNMNDTSSYRAQSVRSTGTISRYYKVIIFGAASVVAVYFVYRSGWVQSLWRRMVGKR
jgi:PDZ domain-containing secreted protein